MCRDLMAKLAEDRLAVAFVGGTQSGKSPLLNAVLEGEVVPSGAGDLLRACEAMVFVISAESPGFEIARGFLSRDRHLADKLSLVLNKIDKIRNHGLLPMPESISVWPESTATPVTHRLSVFLRTGEGRSARGAFSGSLSQASGHSDFQAAARGQRQISIGRRRPSVRRNLRRPAELRAEKGGPAGGHPQPRRGGGLPRDGHSHRPLKMPRPPLNPRQVIVSIAQTLCDRHRQRCRPAPLRSASADCTFPPVPRDRAPRF